MARLLPLLGLAACALGAAAGCTPLHGGALRELPAAAPSIPRAALPSVAAGAPVARAAAAPGLTELPRWAASPPLSPGDRLQVAIEDGEGFSGRYEVGVDGTLRLPHLPPLPVAGRGTEDAARTLAAALVEAQLFRPQRVRVSVLVHEWSHVQVHVSGAVFAPGTVSINVRKPEERALKTDLAAGDFPAERMLAAALRSAGGVRPDAALDRIRLLRNGRTLTLSLADLLAGRGAPAVPLMSGDRIEVPSAGRFDPALVAPSAITPPGIRVFLSNLTVPATGNAIAAVGKEASSLPYGSRLLTAAVSANCVGGVNATSAARHAVLVRTDPLSGREEALERPVNALLRSPNSAEVNPYLMPNDRVACYDSGVTNLRDVVRTLFEILLPIGLL